MALVKQCCCGLNVRSGALLAAFYSLVASGLFVGLLCVRYIGYRVVDTSQTLSIVAYTTIALFALLTAASVLLVAAVTMDVQTLFVPWLVVCVLALIEGCGVFAWVIIARLRRAQEVETWDIVIAAYHLVNSVILMYSVVIVISQLQDLLAGKGTSRYYRRRRQLRRAQLPRHLTPFPLDMLGELAAGVGTPLPPPVLLDQPTSPPPYSEQPPAYRGEGEEGEERREGEDVERGCSRQRGGQGASREQPPSAADRPTEPRDSTHSPLTSPSEGASHSREIATDCNPALPAETAEREGVLAHGGGAMYAGCAPYVTQVTVPAHSGAPNPAFTEEPGASCGRGQGPAATPKAGRAPGVPGIPATPGTQCTPVIHGTQAAHRDRLGPRSPHTHGTARRARRSQPGNQPSNRHSNKPGRPRTRSKQRRHDRQRSGHGI